MPAPIVRIVSVSLLLLTIGRDSTISVISSRIGLPPELLVRIGVIRAFAMQPLFSINFCTVVLVFEDSVCIIARAKLFCRNLGILSMQSETSPRLSTAFHSAPSLVVSR